MAGQATFPCTKNSPQSFRHQAGMRWRCTSQGAPRDGRAPVQSLGTRLRLGRNRTLFSEGDEARCTYEVVTGAVRMCKYLADGRRQIVDFALKGDFVGLAPYKEYTLTAETASDANILAYSTRGLEHFSRESPSLGHWLTTKLTRELSRVQGHLVILGRRTGEERVATFLLMLAERSNAEEGDTIDISMSRQDIADYLGLTIETVCRQLSAMKRREVIYLPEVHQVFVKNMELLRRLATGENAALASIARWG